MPTYPEVAFVSPCPAPGQRRALTSPGKWLVIGTALSTVLLLPVPAEAAAPATNYRAPFSCGETWVGSTRASHSPDKKAIDFNRVNDLGAPAVAAASGVVVKAQASPSGGYGRLVEIDHGNGESSLYAHLNRVDVRAGQFVDVGTQIGAVGKSGRVTGPHLHFEERKGKKVRKAWFEGAKYNLGVLTSSNCVDVPLAGVFSRGGAALPVVYRRSVKATFEIRTGANTTRTLRFGKATDEPVLGDWNGDGISNPGVRRITKKGKARFILRAGKVKTKFVYGSTTDRPVAGDWDGDGRWEVGVYRPATRTFMLRSATGATTSVRLGAAGSIPVTGDWNGDGITDLGVYDPTTQRFTLRTVVKGVAATTVFAFGSPGDLPVVGDWDGNGTTEIGSWTPGSASFRQYRTAVPLSRGVGKNWTKQIKFGRPRR